MTNWLNFIHDLRVLGVERRDPNIQDFAMRMAVAEGHELGCILDYVRGTSEQLEQHRLACERMLRDRVDPPVVFREGVELRTTRVEVQRDSRATTAALLLADILLALTLFLR